MEKKSSYSLFSSFSFAIKSTWNWDKTFYKGLIPNIPLGIASPFLTVYFPKLLIDSVQKNSQISDILLIITGFCLCTLLCSMLSGWCSKQMGSVRYSYQFRLQDKLLEKNMRTDYENIEDPSHLDKYNKALNDSGSCEGLLDQLSGFFINIFGVLSYGSMLLVLSPVITVSIVVSCFIQYFVLRSLRMYIEKHKDSWSPLDRRIWFLAGLTQRLDEAKDIRLYSMESWFKGIFTGLYNERMKWHKKVGLRELGSSLSGYLLGFLRDGIAYAVLINLLLQGNIALGDFVLYLGLTGGFSGWLNSLAGQFGSIAGNCRSLHNVREYLDATENYNHGSGIKIPDFTSVPPEVIFDNVSFRYKNSDRDILKNINLHIKSGEKIALVGENGAGKTTLIKLLCGLYFPTGGNITVGGANSRKYNIEEYYTLFSPVFQDIHMVALPIADFVAMSDGGKTDVSKAEDAIKKAGLSESISKLPEKSSTRLMKGVYENSVDLSGGEQQKLVMARAFYKNAPILILDEPTSALDPIAEGDIYLKYNEMTKNRTSVYISHRLSSTRFCDRILFLEEGEITETGTHEELMTMGGKYSKMFSIQSQYYKEDYVKESII